MNKSNRLNAITYLTMGQSPDGASYNTTQVGLPFFQGKAEFGKVYPVPRKWCLSPIRVAQPGDILISVRAPVGPTNLAFEKSCIGRGLAAIRPMPGITDRDYLWFFLRHVEPLLIKKGQGSTFDAIGGVDLASLKVPALSLTEQRRIAAQLKAQLAAVEEARQAAQARLDEISLLKTQVLGSIFGKIKNTCLIGEIAKVQSGFAFKSQQFQKQGIRLLRNTNILPSRVYWDDMACLPLEEADKYPTYASKPGDVLISLDRHIISSGIKVAHVAPEDLPALLGQRVGRFLIDEQRIDADYLYTFLQTQDFINAISGHEQSLGVPHISPSQIEAIEIPLPNPEQQKRLAKTFMEIMREIDLAKASAASQLSEISILPARLLAQAFGEG
jgi:type I restriction enzyme S subunit